jgi:hypothetical protein
MLPLQNFWQPAIRILFKMFLLQKLSPLRVQCGSLPRVEHASSVGCRHDHTAMRNFRGNAEDLRGCAIGAGESAIAIRKILLCESI